MSTAERNARLDALQKATDDWADKLTASYQHRVKSNKALLQGRTGSERLAQASVQVSSALVAGALSDFLLV